MRVPRVEPFRRLDNGSYPLSTGVQTQVHIWVPPTVTLIILIIIQLILWIVCISFAAISIAITRVVITPLIPAETRTVGIFPSVTFLYLIIKEERFHLTFKVFIFKSRMSTIHLSLSNS